MLLLWLQLCNHVLGEGRSKWIALEVDPLSNLCTWWRSDDFDLSVISVRSAHYHSLRHDMRKFSWLQVCEHNAESALSCHFLDWNELSQTRTDLSELAFTEINLFNVQLVWAWTDFTLDNLANSQVAVCEAIKLWWQITNWLSCLFWRFGFFSLFLFLCISFSSLRLCFFLNLFFFCSLWFWFSFYSYLGHSVLLAKGIKVTLRMCFAEIGLKSINHFVELPHCWLKLVN